jgi:hypothetical protein
MATDSAPADTYSATSAGAGPASTTSPSDHVSESTPSALGSDIQEPETATDFTSSQDSGARLLTTLCCLELMVKT